MGYLKAYAVAIVSMLAGAAVVHNIYSPDLVSCREPAEPLSAHASKCCNVQLNTLLILRRPSLCMSDPSRCTRTALVKRPEELIPSLLSHAARGSTETGRRQHRELLGPELCLCPICRLFRRAGRCSSRSSHKRFHVSELAYLALSPENSPE